MSARRLGVVVNPTAGVGRAARYGPVVLDDLAAAGYAITDLSGPDAATALARARGAVDAQQVDVLVVVGGDGMVHLGTQAVAGTPVPLGIVAVGTGNDFAATLGLPTGDARRAHRALRAALAAGDDGVRDLDAAHVAGPGLSHDGGATTRWVAGAVSTGLDAAVNARANDMRRPRGSARYTVAALRELAGYQPWSYRLTFHDVDPHTVDHGRAGTTRNTRNASLRTRPGPDGTATWTGRAALVTAANGPRIGGGIRVAPQARLDDGLLDVVVATDLSRPGAAVVFPSMFTGAHVRRRKVFVVRARSVTIEPGPEAWASGERPLPSAFGDGERLGPLPVRVEARAGALRALVPPSICRTP